MHNYNLMDDLNKKMKRKSIEEILALFLALGFAVAGIISSFHGYITWALLSYINAVLLLIYSK